MKVSVGLFAIMREILKKDKIVIDLPEGATVEDLFRKVSDIDERIPPLGERIRFALNGSFCRPESRLKEGDEVVLIPPVSGGV